MQYQDVYGNIFGLDEINQPINRPINSLHMTLENGLIDKALDVMQ